MFKPILWRVLSALLLLTVLGQLAPQSLMPATPVAQAQDGCQSFESPAFPAARNEVWVIPSGTNKVVHVASNQREDGVGSQTRKLQLRADQEARLLAGGKYWSWPRGCEQAAQQGFDSTNLSPVTLSELTSEGLLVGPDWRPPQNGGSSAPANCNAQPGYFPAAFNQVWYVGKPGWKAVIFNTAQVGRDPSEHRFFVNPGTELWLLGGGSIFVYPDNCEAVARADYAKLRQPEWSLDDLRAKYLMVGPGWVPTCNLPAGIEKVAVKDEVWVPNGGPYVFFEAYSVQTEEAKGKGLRKGLIEPGGIIPPMGIKGGGGKAYPFPRECPIEARWFFQQSQLPGVTIQQLAAEGWLALPSPAQSAPTCQRAGVSQPFEPSASVTIPTGTIKVFHSWTDWINKAQISYKTLIRANESVTFRYVGGIYYEWPADCMDWAVAGYNQTNLPERTVAQWQAEGLVISWTGGTTSTPVPGQPLACAPGTVETREPVVNQQFVLAQTRWYAFEFKSVQTQDAINRGTRKVLYGPTSLPLGAGFWGGGRATPFDCEAGARAFFATINLPEVGLEQLRLEGLLYYPPGSGTTFQPVPPSGSCTPSAPLGFESRPGNEVWYPGAGPFRILRDVWSHYNQAGRDMGMVKVWLTPGSPVPSQMGLIASGQEVFFLGHCEREARAYFDSLTGLREASLQELSNRGLTRNR